MRILLWVLLLLAVFAGVSLYHARFTEAAREDRTTARVTTAGVDRPLPEGFQGRAVVGEKSGAPIVEGVRPEPQPPITPKRAEPAPARPPAAAGQPVPAGRHVVKRGESLSTICAQHYGTSKPELVTAVARFNGLKSADALREGQELKLPPVGQLGLAGH